MSSWSNGASGDGAWFRFKSWEEALTFRNSSGRPTEKITLPSSSTIAFPNSPQITLAIISKPSSPALTLFFGREASTMPDALDRRSCVTDLTVTFSAISNIRPISLSTNRNIWLYNRASGSSISSSIRAYGDPEEDNDVPCLGMNAENGVYGVRGGREKPRLCERFGNGVCGTMGE